MKAIRQFVERVILRVAELPGRSSPDDMPEMMLVSDAELREILLDELRKSESRKETK